MKGALAWIVALGASVGLHVALAAFLMLGSEPDPLEADPQPAGKIRMEAYEVTETKAKAQDNQGEQAEASETDGQSVDQGAVRSERAEAIDTSAEITKAQEPDVTQVAAVEPSSDVVAPVVSDEITIAAIEAGGADVPALVAQGAVVVAASLDATDAAVVVADGENIEALETAQPVQESIAAKSATLVAAVAPAAPAIKAAVAETITLASANADGDTIIPIAPRAAPVAASPVIGENTGQIAPDAPLTEATAPPANPVTRTDNRGASQQVASAEIEAEAMLAVTSFAGNGGAPFDPVSLAAVASFMRPSNTADSADSARDGISQLLSQIPCARVAAKFIPETGELELRGHVPDGDMRGPIVEAIRAQMGDSIPVTGSMLVLPSPQCNVLSDLEDIGLPQSTDQTNDSLDIGAATQLITLDYSEGQVVEIPLRGSEFASYFYLDFFQIDGNVFHMLPNEYTSLELLQPDEERSIGDDPDGLTLTVEPPFGMELVVAYSSSEPLYDGVREIIEPSAPYLAFIQDRIAVLRAEHEDYKGEWVYMFVQTHGATN